MKPDGSAAYHPSEKAEFLSTFFSSKENQNDVALPSVCFPEPILSSFAFKSSELHKSLSDLDTYGGNEPSGMFPMFLKEISSLIVPKVSVIFRSLIR